MSTVEDLTTVLAELRKLAADVAPIAAHLASIDEALAGLPQSAEVEALRADVEELKAGWAELKAFIDDPPLPERLKALERDVAAFKKATGLSETAMQVGVDAAGVAGDDAHREMARGEAAPLIRDSETRQDLKIATMGERVDEIRDALAGWVKAFRELQSTQLVIIGVAALALAGLVLFLISAFGSPLG